MTDKKIAREEAGLYIAEEKKEEHLEEELDEETKLWSELPVDAWKNSVLSEDSVFHELYKDTHRRTVDACRVGGHDVIIEVGCGTGEVISHLQDADIPRIGIDINEQFIEHCKSEYKDQSGLTFEVQDATKLEQWWEESGYSNLYHSPLLICPNNTIMIMPECIRDEVLDGMRNVAGSKGRAVVTFWNGMMFSHGVMGYYRRNSDLCGEFDLTPEHVNWEEGTIETKTSYKSQWLKAEAIVRWMNSLCIDVALLPAHTKETPEFDHVCEDGMGVYLWLKGKVNSENDAIAKAREYYDSKDAQAFYSTVWGEHNTHIGRYDLVEANPELSSLPVKEKIKNAQLLQEEKMMEFIHHFYHDTKVRCLDMGCGYGGLVRSMAQRGIVWDGVGVDISGGMIDAASRLTEEEPEEVRSVLTFLRESYMNTSVQDEGMDLCISMDAFLHVGPGQHDNVLQEAWRVLRPGGRLIFTDIVARPDAPEEAQVLYERLGLTSFATVQGYKDKSKKYGFGEFAFEDHSSNVTSHYRNVLDVFESLYAEGKVDVSESFKDKMCDGLRKWRDLAPSCLQWGIISMRKLEQLSDDDSSK